MCERPENVLNEKVRIAEDARSLEFWSKFNEKGLKKKAKGYVLPLNSQSSKMKIQGVKTAQATMRTS